MTQNRMMCNERKSRAAVSRTTAKCYMVQTDAAHLDDDDDPSSLSNGNNTITVGSGADVFVPDALDDTNMIDRTRYLARRNVPSILSQRRSSHNDSKIHRHLVTQHDYHDHALDPVNDSNMTSVFTTSLGRNGNQSPSTTNSLTTPFPTKLYEMIEQIEAQGLSYVVAWQPHGRCFKVHEMSTFKIIIQNYFKLSKLASFQRQLNLYGFQRLTVGLDKGSYYHELFLRSRPDLVYQIERVKVKGTGVRAKANPDEEPHLYSYPAVDARASLALTESTANSCCANQELNMVEVQRTKGAITCTKNGDSFIPSLYNVGGVVSKAGVYTNEGIDASDASYDSFEAPCTTMNGLVRNLSSLNVLSSYGNESSVYKPRTTNMRNASFPAPTHHQNINFPISHVASFPTLTSHQNIAFPPKSNVASFPAPASHQNIAFPPKSNVLRNISSCVLSNSQSFASIFTNDSSAAGLADEQTVDRSETFQQQKFIDVIDMDGNATDAVEKLRLSNETDDNVSFDKLVDEMFQNDQNVEFPDLIKLATEPDYAHAV